MLMVFVWLVVGIVGTVAIITLVFWILGQKVPMEHRVSVSMPLDTTAEEVFIVLDDIANQPSWAPGVDKVEKLPNRNGHETWRMTMGRNTFVLEITERVPPTRLTRTIGDDNGMFSGSWSYEITRKGNGCEVLLTENGRVPGAIPRAMMKHLFGYYSYMEKNMTGLAARFGQQAKLTRA